MFIISIIAVIVVAIYYVLNEVVVSIEYRTIELCCMAAVLAPTISCC